MVSIPSGLRLLRRRGVLLGVCAFAAAAVGLGGATRGAAAGLTACTPAALRAAVAAGGTIKLGCSGTITLGAPITISKGAVTIDASGQHVAFTSSGPAEGTRLFAVTGGKVTLVNLTFQNAIAQGANGSDGGDGGDGSPGQDGGPLPNINGKSGTDGGAGDKGINGFPQAGGALTVGNGASVTLSHCTFSGNGVVGGNGGNGGKGAAGGKGGNGTNLLGGSGGNGGAGGDGGNGGTGGAAKGGAIYNLGTLTIIDGTFTNNKALGGAGGAGSSGGNGGGGGNAGTFVSGDQVGDGGNGGAAGYGGDGGGGGIAVGAAIYNGGTLTIRHTTFTSSKTAGGNGGAAGSAGGAAPGGGGTVTLATANGGIPGGDGGYGGDGGSGGSGGKGGSALGAGIYSPGPVTLDTVTFANGSGKGGDGGAAQGGTPGAGGGKGGDSLPTPPGAGGNGGPGGNGGDAGDGGGGGPAIGGATFSGAAISQTHVTTTGNTVVGGKGDPEQGAAGGAGGLPGTGTPPGKPGKNGQQGLDGKDGSAGGAVGSGVVANGVSVAKGSGSFSQCPAVGADSSCGILIEIGDNGKLTGFYDPNQTPIDGASGDDTLIGVVNKSSAPVDSIMLSGPNIFGFDNDGLCTYKPFTCTWPAPTGYEGPNTSFSASDADTGTVNFSGGLAPGKSAYFSLEGTTPFPCRIDETHDGWRFEAAQQTDVAAGAKGVTVTPPPILGWQLGLDASSSGGSQSPVPATGLPLPYALPLADKCTLATPIVLPDVDLQLGNLLSLTAYQNTLVGDDLNSAQAALDVAGGRFSASATDLTIAPDYSFKAGSVEVDAFGAVLTGSNVTFDPATGLKADQVTIALPAALGDTTAKVSDFAITKAGGVQGTFSGVKFSIGDVKVDITNARLTDTGFSIDSADLVLPAYLASTHIHVDHLVYDYASNSFTLQGAAIDLKLDLGKLKVAVGGTFSLTKKGFQISANGSVRVPDTPTDFFNASASLSIASVDCADVVSPATEAPCTNGAFFQGASLSLTLGTPIPIGSTGLALAGFSGSLDKPYQPSPTIDAAGAIHGVTYTWHLGAQLVTAADNGFTLDGTVDGTLSTNGNFGISLGAKLFRFFTLTGGVCVRFVDVPGDSVCAKHISAANLARVVGTGIFVDATARAGLSYEGALGTVAAGLDAGIFGRWAQAGGQNYLDAVVSGHLNVVGHSWVLPDIEGRASLTGELGRFTTPSGQTTLGIKATAIGDLSAHGTFVDTTYHIERSIFIDENGNYIEENVNAYTPTGTPLRHEAAVNAAPATPPASTTYGFDVGPGQTQTIVTVTWQAGAAAPTVTLIRPDGLNVLANIKAGQPQIAFRLPGGHPTKQQQASAFVIRQAATNELQIYLPQPTAGHWAATVSATTSPTFDVRGNMPVPALRVALAPTSPRTPAHPLVQISGTTSAPGTVALYATPSPCTAGGAPTAPGLLLSDALPINDGQFAYTWDTSKVPNGKYTVYAVVNNGTGPIVRGCSPHVATVQHTAPKPAKHAATLVHAVAATPAVPRQLVAVISAHAQRAAAKSAAGSSSIPVLFVNGTASRKPDASGAMINPTPDIALNDYLGITAGKSGAPTVDSYVQDELANGKWRQYRCTKPDCADLHFLRFMKNPTKTATENRADACGRRPFTTDNEPGPIGRVINSKTKKVTKPSDRTSCDEYPFASSDEGGAASIVIGVELGENRRQGGIISAFMRRNNLALKKSRGEFYVCVELADGRTAGHC